MSNETSSEDRTLLAALEALERGIDSPAGDAARRDETAETLARLYTEVLGVIPFELDPVAPSPAVRERLMALVHDDHGDETQPAAAPAAVPVRSAQEVRAPRPVAPPARTTPVPRRTVRPSRWPLALAAALALVAVGLSAWLYLQLGEQRRTIAQLRQDLTAERSRVASALAEARSLRTSKGDLEGLREKFALVTSRDVAVAAMRPAGKTPLQPQARGILFVAADHQHWYLSLAGLRPAEPGQTYKLWFMADQGPVAAGSFTARPGEPMELSSKHMPAGTKGAMVTLEQDPQAVKPAGPEVLRAAAMYPVS